MLAVRVCVVTQYARVCSCANQSERASAYEDASACVRGLHTITHIVVCVCVTSRPTMSFVRVWQSGNGNGNGQIKALYLRQIDGRSEWAGAPMLTHMLMMRVRARIRIGNFSFHFMNLAGQWTSALNGKHMCARTRNAHATLAHPFPLTNGRSSPLSDENTSIHYGVYKAK